MAASFISRRHWSVALLLGSLLASAASANCLQGMRGELVQGGVIWGSVLPGSSVTLNGKALDVLADGTTVAGFGRDAAPTRMLADGRLLLLWRDQRTSQGQALRHQARHKQVKYPA